MDSGGEILLELEERLNQVERSIDGIAETELQRIHIIKEDVKKHNKTMDAQILNKDKICVKIASSNLKPRWSYINEIYKNISLSGLQYIAKGESSKLHRLVWTVLHFTVIVLSSSYILDEYHRWQRSPILQSVGNSMTKSNEVPFPGITVCEPYLFKERPNMEEVLSRCVKNETLWLCKDEELLTLELIYFLKQNNPLYPGFTISKFYLISYFNILNNLHPFLQENRTVSGEEYLKALESIKKKLGKDHKMSWKHSQDETFKPFYQKYGSEYVIPHPQGGGISVCQTYNGVRHGPQYMEYQLKKEMGIGEETNITNRKYSIGDCNWTPEQMLNKTCTESSYILYTNDTLIFATHKSKSKSKKKLKSNFLLSIGNPADYPIIGWNTEILPIRRDAGIIVQPKLITSDGLEVIDVSKRGCAFSSEIQLSLFQFYTYRNCLLECQVRCATTRCGCLPYLFVPVYNRSVRMCNLWKTYNCYVSTQLLDPRVCGCDCLPDCVSLSYDTNAKIIDQYGYPAVPNILILYYKSEFTTKFRYSKSNVSELIAYSLGIVGVFNGFSLIVVWEICYWLTLRLWVTVRRHPTT